MTKSFDSISLRFKQARKFLLTVFFKDILDILQPFFEMREPHDDAID